MTEHKSPLEQALDLVFYAPVGLALTAKEELPRLVEKGRQRVSTQMMMARMIGQFAVNQGQKEASKVARQAGDTLAGLGIIPGGDRVASQPAASTAPAAAVSSAPAASSPASGNGKPGDAVRPAPTSDGLAIPGYDSLSASQVVQRLAGLAPGELEAVRQYEAGTRGRRTILNRVAQLQTGSA